MTDAANAESYEDDLDRDAGAAMEAVQPDRELVLTAREDWDAYCGRPLLPPPPRRLTADEFPRLDAAERRLYNRARTTYLAGLLVTHPQARALFDEITTLLLLNKGQPVAREGLAVSGPSGMGKTTTVARYAKRHQEKQANAHPRLAGSNGFLPVVYFTIPSRPGSKAVAQAIADFVGWPYRDRDSETVITAGVTAVLRECQTSLVIVDEYHFLLKTLRRGGHPTRAVVEADNFIKALQDTVPATFLLLGINLHDLGAQTEGRFKRFGYAPYGYSEKDEQEQTAWAEICKSFEEKLPLLNHPLGLLCCTLAPYLHARTGGRVGSLSALIREAGIRAVRDGTERIDLSALQRVRIDKTAEDLWANANGRARIEAEAMAAEQEFLRDGWSSADTS